MVGFKPPYGRVPQAAPFNLDTYCHCGPLARTVADCALFENAIAGPHPADITSLRPKVELPERLDGVEGLRVALSVDLGDWPVDPEVRANTLAVADALRCGGRRPSTSSTCTCPAPRSCAPAPSTTTPSSGPGSPSRPPPIPTRSPITPRRSGRPSRRWPQGGSIGEGLAIEAALYEPVGALLDDYDALICPTAGTRGLAAGEDYVDTGLEVGGELLDAYSDSMLTVPFNLFSRCPVLAVPSGFADNGVPTGVQIVGRTYDDETVFRLGAALEQQRPWPAPSLPPFAQ